MAQVLNQVLNDLPRTGQRGQHVHEAEHLGLKALVLHGPLQQVPIKVVPLQRVGCSLFSVDQIEETSTYALDLRLQRGRLNHGPIAPIASIASIAPMASIAAMVLMPVMPP